MTRFMKAGRADLSCKPAALQRASKQKLLSSRTTPRYMAFVHSLMQV